MASKLLMLCRPSVRFFACLPAPVRTTSPIPSIDTGGGQNTIFGRYYGNPATGNFQGNMDEILLWGRDFTEAEVQTLFKYYSV